MKNLMILILFLFAQAGQAESVYKCEVNGHPAYQKTPCGNDAGQAMDVKPLSKSGLNLSPGFKNFINDWERQQYELQQQRIREARRQEELNIERQKAWAQHETAVAQRETARAQRSEAAAQRETAEAIRNNGFRPFYPYRY